MLQLPIQVQKLLKQNQKFSQFPCPHVQFQLVDQKRSNFLHHNQMFDVIIKKICYDIKYLIMMQKARGLCHTLIGHVDGVNAAIIILGYPDLSTTNLNTVSNKL